MNRYVADTHALLWSFGNPSKLGRNAARVFAELGTTVDVHVSTVSLWEIARLYELGRVDLPAGYAGFSDGLTRKPGIRIEPLFIDDVDEARRLGDLADPFDRLIAGTALRLNAPLLSRDSRMKGDRRLRIVW
jgi:PIN domain nuclease of toxin-antitoxin system